VACDEGAKAELLVASCRRGARGDEFAEGGRGGSAGGTDPAAAIASVPSKLERRELLAEDGLEPLPLAELTAIRLAPTDVGATTAGLGDTPVSCCDIMLPLPGLENTLVADAGAPIS
jgi:hypothetical protein